MLTDSKETLSVFVTEVESSSDFNILKDGNASVSLTFNGAVDYNVIQQVTDFLAQKQIPVEKVITSPVSFSFIIHKENLKISKNILCDEFLK